MAESGDDVPSTSAWVGKKISGRYRVDAVLGEGGMGAVVRAEDLRLKRSVAIKVMLPELGNSPEFAKRFQREAELAARLQHPNIVSLHDFGTTEDGVSFLVMQLLQGQELGTRLGQPLDPRRAVSITAQVLRALEHAHAQGVIHRDLKPQNVFLTEDASGGETVRILDFGLAKPADDLAQQSKGLTRSGMVLGTPTYMSPEQAVGTRVDARTDLYSTGVLLYEMLAGTPPLVDDDAIRLLQRQVTEDPPDLPDVVPAGLRAIVRKLLAKLRDERFESATAALAALEDPSIWATPDAVESAAEPPTVSAPAPPAVREADDGEPAVSSVPVVDAADRPRPANESAPRRRPRRPARRRRASRAGVRTPLVLAAILTALFVGWLVAPGRSAAERLDELTTRIAEIAGRIVSGNSARDES